MYFIGTAVVTYSDGTSDIDYSPTCGWWKINGGAVDFGYSGSYDSPAYGTWTVSSGAVVFS